MWGTAAHGGSGSQLSATIHVSLLPDWGCCDQLPHTVLPWLHNREGELPGAVSPNKSLCLLTVRCVITGTRKGTDTESSLPKTRAFLCTEWVKECKGIYGRCVPACHSELGLPDWPWWPELPRQCGCHVPLPEVKDKHFQINFSSLSLSPVPIPCHPKSFLAHTHL